MPEKTFMDERAEVVAYLLSTLIREPDGEAEEHANYVIETLASDIRRAKHALFARGEL